MSSPYDPCGKIYSILSEEWTSFLWFFEPVFIPRAFREHFVLVLGWTTGRRGYVSIVMITSDIPDGANPDHHVRIRSPRRRSVADGRTVTLRKNKTFAALVEHSYVRLDWVWEVPFAILLVVPRTGMQLMLRAVSMERIMGFYSEWGWERTCPGSENIQWAELCHGGDAWGLLGSMGRGGGAENCQTTAEACRGLDELASLGMGDRDGGARDEGGGGSGGTGSCDSASKLEDEDDGRLERTCWARQEMVYAGDAHCAALAKLLREV